MIQSFLSLNWICDSMKYLFCEVKYLGSAGQNGTIDGQGKMWWDLWWNRTLQYTRGHLVEIMNSHNILISNLTFLNSPFWTLHPVYCRLDIFLFSFFFN